MLGGASGACPACAVSHGEHEWDHPMVCDGARRARRSGWPGAGKAWVPRRRLVVPALPGLHMTEDGMEQRPGALMRPGGDLEPRPLVLQALDEVLPAGLPLAGGHH